MKDRFELKERRTGTEYVNDTKTGNSIDVQKSNSSDDEYTVKIVCLYDLLNILNEMENRIAKLESDSSNK